MNLSWFARIYNASSGSFFTGRFIIKNLDIAYNIGRSANLCPKSVCLWPSSKDGSVYIPYSISSDFDSYDTTVIKASLSDIEDATCIRFKPKTSEADYITFVASTGCWSSVGRVGGVQYISLEKPGCVWSGIITHEVLHALGLNHEHVRRDRDKHVEVEWNNIQSDARSNFEMADTYNKDLTAYDYDSILHYPNMAFSKDGIEPTLVAVLDSSLKFGQQFSMSYLDIKKINSLYKCRITTQGTSPVTTKTTSTRTPSTTKTTTTASTTTTTARTTTTPTTTRKTTTTTPTTTRKTTATTPRTMRTTTTTTPTTTRKTTTMTPSTIRTTTTTTSTRMSFQTGCGGNLTGPEGALISPNYPQNYPSNAYCHWNITTTERFRITFKDFNIEGDGMNCQYDKLRIYNGRDFDVLYQLRDFCGQNLPLPITSSSNSMQIVFTSDLSIEKRGFSLVYQRV
ncbi:astacin-like metalloendopeptidase [Ranitomeya imitator]|uniref:astacin-like metalloendopeptidase n=1 Tax=Ranitomeya imitator TaxID=111125 RepID=UPI0037E729FA